MGSSTSTARPFATLARDIRRRQLMPLAGRARYLEGGGIPLGVEQDASFPAREVTLKPYTTILLYTDGLIEFDRNLERESFRLLAALNERVHDTSPTRGRALAPGPQQPAARRHRGARRNDSSGATGAGRDETSGHPGIGHDRSTAGLTLCAGCRARCRSFLRSGAGRRRSGCQRDRARLPRVARRVHAAPVLARRAVSSARCRISVAGASPARTRIAAGDLEILAAITRRFEVGRGPPERRSPLCL